MVQVIVKHAGKQHKVEVDIDKSPEAFKESIYQVTGVPVARMKVMVKSTMVREDTEMAQLLLKPDQLITVIGTAGPLPAAPAETVTFLEDMDAGAVALQGGTPPGLINLGQTCYLNSTIQALKVMPELRTALEERPAAPATPDGRLATSIKNLFVGMAKTADAIPPLLLLSNLRSVAPQFAEQDSRGAYAQQDADEAWTQLLSSLRSTLRQPNSSSSFIDDYLSLRLTKSLKCIEAEDEPPTTSHEDLLKLECNISISTNFLLSGILENFDQSIEKHSPSLHRTALYKQSARLSRLPEYLAIHMVRFYWRRDIQKKAKIMRKVKYPLQLDAIDLVTDDLRTRIQPINSAMRQIVKSRDDRIKQSSKEKNKGDSPSEADVRAEEKKTVQELMEKAGGAASGENISGMYELCAMVTHKGASADSGHYIGWTRNDETEARVSGEEEWYKFDDDKVSTVNAAKITSMDGGGEDSVAYILLYRTIRP